MGLLFVVLVLASFFPFSKAQEALPRGGDEAVLPSHFVTMTQGMDQEVMAESLLSTSGGEMSLSDDDQHASNLVDKGTLGDGHNVAMQSQQEPVESMKKAPAAPETQATEPIQDIAALWDVASTINIVEINSQSDREESRAQMDTTANAICGDAEKGAMQAPQENIDGRNEGQSPPVAADLPAKDPVQVREPVEKEEKKDEKAKELATTTAAVEPVVVEPVVVEASAPEWVIEVRESNVAEPVITQPPLAPETGVVDSQPELTVVESPSEPIATEPTVAGSVVTELLTTQPAVVMDPPPTDPAGTEAAPTTATATTVTPGNQVPVEPVAAVGSVEAPTTVSESVSEQSSDDVELEEFKKEKDAAAELEALQEIAELQREDQEELREESEAITADEQRLRTLADEAAEKAKANLEAEKRTWSQKDDRAASRTAMKGVIDDDSVQGSTDSSNAEHIISQPKRETAAHSSFLGRKGGPSVRGRPAQAQVQGSDATSSSSGAARKSVGGIRSSDSVMSGLAEHLASATKAGIVGDAEEDARRTTSALRAYRLSRTVARPVERVLRVYDDHRTSLYEVLGLARDCDDEDIKQAYRAYALLVHPDKNPHPQAKAAFEAIQDAFRTLSSPLARGEYDKDFARKNKLTVKRVKKKVIAFFLNHFSNLQLLCVRVGRGETEEIKNEVTSLLKGKLDTVQNRVTHLQLLPSYVDRVTLLHEFIGENWRALASIVTLISIL